MSEPTFLAAGPAVATDASLAHARQALQLGRPEAALRVLGNDPGRSPDELDYWYLRAFALLQLGRDPEAEAAARQGLIIDPDSVKLLQVLALVLSEQDRLAEAETAILTALRQDARSTFSLCTYARLVARDRQFDKARRLLDLAAGLAPGARDVTRSRSYVAYLSGETHVAPLAGRAYLAFDADDARPAAPSGVTVLTRVAAPTRAGRSPLLLPLWPLEKLGTVGFWLLGVGGLYGLRALGQDDLSLIWALVYASLCIYSWVLPPLLRWWYRRG